LIRKLALESKPVKPPLPPVAQLGKWLAFAFLYVGIGMVLIGTRQDLRQAALAPAFLLQAFLPLFFSLAASALAFTLGIPGEQSRWHRIISIFSLLVCALFLSYFVFAAHTFDPGNGFNCVRNILFLAAPPALFFFYLLKKMAPLQKNLASFAAFTGAAALASSATRLICPDSDPLHFLIWHFLPVISLGILGSGTLAWVRRTRR